jgi:uncharacterized protein (DUF488 family)
VNFVDALFPGKGIALVLPFFTIGHSTRSLPDFLGLLSPLHVQLVVDVQSIPRSRKNPQYNIDTLPGALSRYHIDYKHIPELGGLRPHHSQIPAATNAFWRERSFRNFADYAMTESFRLGLAKLRKMGHAQTCTIMCAEALWWRCHRRILQTISWPRARPFFTFWGQAMSNLHT